MKRLGFMIFVFAFACGLECEAQFSANGHLVYGKPRTDGYQKITKGAFWSKRPEAKLIYEGARPEGYTVVVLNEDCFVRFIDGEHNQNDKNYIVFPKGEIVYSDNKSGQLYAASCGNKIELVRPADFVVEKETVVKKSSQQSETSSHNVPDYGKTSIPPPPPPPPAIEIKHSKLYYFNKNYPLVKWIAGVGIAYGTYRIIENQGRSPEPIVVIPPPKKEGNPVDAQPQGRIVKPIMVGVYINF